MAYVRTMRGPRHSRHGYFVPGGLACAAARPWALFALTLRGGPPAEAEEGADTAVTPESTASEADRRA